MWEQMRMEEGGATMINSTVHICSRVHDMMADDNTCTFTLMAYLHPQTHFHCKTFTKRHTSSITHIHFTCTYTKIHLIHTRRHTSSTTHIHVHKKSRV